jgi:murein DD-endopeptidase MepM/ murein hydrolase activator NlpD
MSLKSYRRGRMGSYNSQYESYYSSMVNKRRNYGGYNYSSKKSNVVFRFDRNFVIRRLTQELIGVFILFTFVITCKLIVTPETKAAYNYSKEVLNTNYEVAKIVTTFKEFDYKNVETKVIEGLESLMIKISGGKSIKDEINMDYIAPITDNIILGFGETTKDLSGAEVKHEGIDIAASEGTEVVCPSKGKVKSTGQDEKSGKYIVIDHGNGIETKLANLSEVLVGSGDSIEKGQVIGKSGSAGNSASAHLHFELLYMGESKNPEEYIEFK